MQIIINRAGSDNSLDIACSMHFKRVIMQLQLRKICNTLEENIL